MLHIFTRHLFAVEPREATGCVDSLTDTKHACPERRNEQPCPYWSTAVVKMIIVVVVVVAAAAVVVVIMRRKKRQTVAYSTIFLFDMYMS
jgi:hypothetical protein